MDIQDLDVYRLSEDLAVELYSLTKNFPDAEKFGLTSQIRRAGVSVSANIAEAWGRYHYKDKLVFLYHSRGSLVEVRSLVRIATRLGFMETNEILDGKINVLRVKLHNFIVATRKRVKQ